MQEESYEIKSISYQIRRIEESDLDSSLCNLYVEI